MMQRSHAILSAGIDLAIIGGRRDAGDEQELGLGKLA
jgi:hypothetical protein